MPRSAGIAILFFLVVQAALPLSYYLGSDPYDERFAWRMFSPLSLARCLVSFSASQDGEMRVVDATHFVHPVAVNIMEQGIGEAVDRFAELWCPKHPGAALYTAHTCMRPETLELTICNAVKSKLADVLDAYERNWSCRNSSAEICLERDCGDLDVERCFVRRCLVLRRPHRQDLCEGR